MNFIKPLLNKKNFKLKKIKIYLLRNLKQNFQK